MLPNVIFRTPSEHRRLLAHARIMIEQSRKLLRKGSANTFVSIKHHDLFPFDREQHLEPEVEATANRTTMDRQAVDELIRLTDKLLRHSGQDIDADNRIFRCSVISEFILATYAVRPDLALYRILLRDNEQNISQVFVATWHWGSGTPDLQVYREGPWEKTFRKIAARIVDLAPSQHLH